MHSDYEFSCPDMRMQVAKEGIEFAQCFEVVWYNAPRATHAHRPAQPTTVPTLSGQAQWPCSFYIRIEKKNNLLLILAL